MSKLTIRIATRKSLLALWQAEFVANKLKSIWPNIETELVPMQTKGDRYFKDKLQSIGGKGLFIKELEKALLNNQADIAVHSMKDVPSSQPDGLCLPVICERHNPYDALLSNDYATLASFPDGAVIGTSSLRRESQILASFPKLKIKTLRGNIHTRIDKLKNKEYDGIILAASGLLRMGLQDEIKEILDESCMLPACGQGALGIECRADDENIKRLLQPLNHDTSAICIHTERYVNSKLGGSCHTPIGIFTDIKDKSLILKAKVLSADGKQVVAAQQAGDISKNYDLAEKLFADLQRQGVERLLNTKST